MRRFVSFTGLVIVVFLAAAAATFAAPDFAAAPARKAAPKIAVAPHRAIYALSLASAKSGSAVADADGHMLFEWRDVCDGWAVQQQMQMHFSYADGDTQDTASTELTWEAKDGKSYDFTIRRTTDGKQTAFYQGKARLKDDGSGSVTFTAPKAQTVALPKGTIFPSAHTELILQKALSGTKFFNERVFDGDDDSGAPDNGASDISAFISRPRATAKEAALGAAAKDSPLLAAPAFPVHLAFFGTGPGADTPDYEMDLELEPNGIARHMNIDYGDFAVNGTLEDVEALPAPACK